MNPVSNLDILADVALIKYEILDARARKAGGAKQGVTEEAWKIFNECIMDHMEEDLRVCVLSTDNDGENTLDEPVAAKKLKLWNGE